MDEKKSKYILLAMNKDYCPDNDAIIYQNMCGQCPHYRGFELYNAQPCIKCSFYEDLEKH